MSFNGSSDQDLLKRLVAAKNEGFIEELLALFEGKLYGFCSNLLQDETATEEVLSRVFEKVITTLDQAVEDNLAVSSLLYRSVVEEIAVQESASEQTLEKSITKENLRLVVPNLAENTLEQYNDKDYLRLAVQSLPYEYKVVYLLHEATQLDALEISKILSISELEIKAYLHRARLMVCSYLRKKESPVLSSKINAPKAKKVEKNQEIIL